MIPDHANRASFFEEREWVSRHFPFVHLTGLCADFLAASMNDQIVQGLKLGVLFGSHGA
jgi:hypothetical protein